MTLKYIIDIKELQTRPHNLAPKDAWGFYKLKDDESCIYLVHKYGVSRIYGYEEIFNSTYRETGEQISETLLLKLVAAASRAEVLK